MKTYTGIFFEDVYAVARMIPYGRITTYGAIAAYLSTPKSARMVGWSLNAAKLRSDIPAHRVVNKRGLLTGKIHFESPTTMEELLSSEGVEIVNGQIVAMERYFWDPAIELKLS
jgi:methylated-DNA-protein-cysteine methyltransferase related protein